MQTRARVVVFLAAALFVADVTLISTLGTRAPGPVLSDLIQCFLAGLLIYHCIQAGRRSVGLARSFWFLATATFAVAFAGMSLMAYSDAFPAPPVVKVLSNLVFCFWFFPLALAMFLDPERETEGLDLPISLDFMQAAVLCVAAYVYFFYIPESAAAADLSPTVWTPYFAGYAFLSGAFLIRSLLTRSTLARTLFRGLVAFLAYSAVADLVYRFGPHGVSDFPA